MLASWIVLLVVQTTLVAKERVGAHRRIGFVGTALATLVVTAGVAAALSASAQRQQARLLPAWTVCSTCRSSSRSPFTTL